MSLDQPNPEAELNWIQDSIRNLADRTVDTAVRLGPALVAAEAFLDDPSLTERSDGRRITGLRGEKYDQVRYGLGLRSGLDPYAHDPPLGYYLRKVDDELILDKPRWDDPSIVWPPANRHGFSLPFLSPEHPKHKPEQREHARAYVEKLGDLATREQLHVNSGIYEKAATWFGVLYRNPVSAEHEALHPDIVFTHIGLAALEVALETARLDLSSSRDVIYERAGISDETIARVQNYINSSMGLTLDVKSIQAPEEIAALTGEQIASAKEAVLWKYLLPPELADYLIEQSTIIRKQQRILDDVITGTTIPGDRPGIWAAEREDMVFRAQLALGTYRDPESDA